MSTLEDRYRRLLAWYPADHRSDLYGLEAQRIVGEHRQAVRVRSGAAVEPGRVRVVGRLRAVRDQGYDTPTPIQAQAIPAVLAGQDLLAGAQTGTGKTAAFTLPMLHKLSLSEPGQNRFGGKAIRALVLTPTRELAAQVQESFEKYGAGQKLNVALVIGG